MKKLIESLDELESLLLAVDGLVKRQNAVGSIPGSVDPVERALKHCQSSVAALDASVCALKQHFAGRGRFRQGWASVKTVVKEEKVHQLRGQIESDVIKLHTAITINMSYVQ